MPEFSVGDRVTIVSGSEYDGISMECNPPHGYGGEVVEVDDPATHSDDHYIYVEWEHSYQNNWYRPTDLEHLAPKVVSPTVSPRATFRNWMLKLDGKETGDNPPQGKVIYALPIEPLGTFQSFLENYRSTGKINPSNLIHAFTWASTEQGDYFWSCIHNGEGDQEEARCILDNWCDQMGILPRASQATTVDLSW